MKNENKLTKTKDKDVTAADVKVCKGYESISDESAQNIADVIRVYSEIIYHCFTGEGFKEEKGKVISLNSQENKKAA